MAGIGPVGDIGPGGKYAGRIVGLKAGLKALGEYGPAALVFTRFAKDFDDSPAERIVGTDEKGRVIKEQPRPGFTP
jgi:hypothetical protein